jgi:hypothetical protein
VAWRAAAAAAALAATAAASEKQRKSFRRAARINRATDQTLAEDGRHAECRKANDSLRFETRCGGDEHMRQWHERLKEKAWRHP